MPSAARPDLNKIWGVYARGIARRVSSGGVRRGWQNFSGRRGGNRRPGSMLALVAAPIGTAGEVASLVGRNGGNPPFFTGRSGDVAQVDVARQAQGRRNPTFFVPGAQIANLTTRAGRTVDAPASAGREGQRSRGVSPFSRLAVDPMPVAYGGARFGKTFGIEGPALAGHGPVFQNREVHDWQQGSGVRDRRNAEPLALDRAESGRRLLGQGEGGAHGPLDVGKSLTLWIGGGGVN